MLYLLADRDVTRLAAVAYRGAATQVRRLIASAPGVPDINFRAEAETR